MAWMDELRDLIGKLTHSLNPEKLADFAKNMLHQVDPRQSTLHKQLQHFAAGHVLPTHLAQWLPGKKKEIGEVDTTAGGRLPSGAIDRLIQSLDELGRKFDEFSKGIGKLQERAHPTVPTAPNVPQPQVAAGGAPSGILAGKEPAKEIFPNAPTPTPDQAPAQDSYKSPWERLDKLIGMPTGQGPRAPVLGEGAEKAAQAAKVEGMEALTGKLAGFAAVIGSILEIKHDLTGAGQAGLRAVKSERIEDVAHEGLQAGTKVAGAAANVVGTVGGAMAFGPVGALLGPVLDQITQFVIQNNPFFKMFEAGLKVVSFLRDFSDELIKANLRFSEFSGAMAAVAAREEVRQIQLSQERGDRRAGSAEFLAEGRNQLERTFVGVEDAWARLKNDIIGTFDRLLANSVVGQLIKNLGETANRILDRLEANSAKETSDEDFAKALEEARRLAERFARPNRMGQP